MIDEARHTCAFVGGLGCPQVAIGAAIEGWKVLKIMRRRGMLATEYWTRRKEDRAVQVGMTAMEAATDEHDARAMKVSERNLGESVVRRGGWARLRVVGGPGRCPRAPPAVMTVERGLVVLCSRFRYCNSPLKAWCEETGVCLSVPIRSTILFPTATAKRPAWIVRSRLFSGGSTTVSSSYACSLPVAISVG